ncbi:helix-turn-helix transcriptional regulator [Paraliomyxa miuraensis]|uniref:helix-turn-helix transcriptional regulator n=1 Tax=Paraliomyxa miuraensis TaxID=376150 RepID=UPI0022597D17|nr:helix-turn-helix transcriptional regulator [Paraliomyxa miuraensis]MCX4247511.1 helix-turn-helix transcriptional regulator [Paraliomyxa miuraensis]
MVRSYPTDMAATAIDLGVRLCAMAAETSVLPQWRQQALHGLRTRVRFEAGLFHELSPRAPLDRAGVLDWDLAGLAATRRSWDDLAVDFGPLRERALVQGGVATDREAFGHRGPARSRWERQVARPLGIRSLLAIHLVLDARIIAVVMLARRRDPPFSTAEREAMQPLAPVLAVCDGLHQSRSRWMLPGVATAVRCVDERLTSRQRQVVEYVALGRTNEEIAEVLGISANTVRNLLVKVRARVGAANRAELVRVAVLHPGTPGGS